MDTLVTILTVACAVGLASAIGRYVRVPLPLIQIALGALFALPAIGRGVVLDPNVFLAAFVAPLLFADAWQTSKREFVRNWRIIVMLAFGLALITVAGTGLFVNWMVPALGLPAAFALAAVLAPTDAVAVQAIARSSPLPRQLMHIMEGEGLLNDATGLVALRFAVATAATGVFFPLRAAADLAWTAAGGFALGLLVGGIFFRLLQRFSSGGDTASLLLVPPLPIAVFELAEHLHLSGVLAAVAAGVAGEVVSRRFAVDYTVRLATQSLWSMLSVGLNGAIFVILGMQLPAILANAPDVARELEVKHPAQIALYVVGITGALLFIRFLWTLVSFAMTFIRMMRQHQPLPPHEMMRGLHWAVTLGGVRGAVTLGAVLTLPLDFRGRDTAILLATGVILVSLFTSSAFLPRVAKALAPFMGLFSRREGEEHDARLKLAHASLAAIETEVKRLNELHDGDIALINEASAAVTAPYIQTIHAADLESDDGRLAKQALAYYGTLRMTAIAARRRELVKLVRTHEIDDELYRELVQELDLAQASMPKH